MSQLDERSRAMLARGLETFDRAMRRRRLRLRALRLAPALALLALAGFAIERAAREDRRDSSTPAGLPAHVELILDDRDLAAELELARACERVDRVDGRLMVVECSVAPANEDGRSDGRRPDAPIG